MKNSVKLLILQTVRSLVRTKSFKNVLAHLAVGYLNVAIPVIEGGVPVRQSDLIPRRFVTLSTTQARTLRSSVIMVNNL